MSRIVAIDLCQVRVPFLYPVTTSVGTDSDRDSIMVRVETEHAQGWGECVAELEPRYSEEYLDGAWEILTRYLVPSLFEAGTVERPEDLAVVLGWVRGHRMAKAALEAALTDALLQELGISLGAYLGASRARVNCGVSVGLADAPQQLLDEIDEHLSHGYQRVKLKIEPGRDIEFVRVVRDRFPDLPLSVDANGAYGLDDRALFEQLDELDLTMIEQPLAYDDLVDHARIQSWIATPLCLDESIRGTADAAAAVQLDACRVINIKPARVGGLLEAKRIHDIARGAGMPVWIGGMDETGIGRAVNVALAALPGVTMPGDTSPSSRYFAEDLTDPFEMDADGTMLVPSGPGIGVAPYSDRLGAATVRRWTYTGGDARACRG